MASVEVARHFGRPKLSCGILFKSWFQTEESECGHGRQQARRNVLGTASAKEEPIPSIKMTCPARGLKAPWISAEIMEGDVRGPEEAPGISAEIMEDDVRGLEEAPGISKEVMEGDVRGPEEGPRISEEVMEGYVRGPEEAPGISAEIMEGDVRDLEEASGISAEIMEGDVRGLEEGPGISEEVMECEGVQTATTDLRQIPETSPCCGPHRREYNMIFTQPPGVSSALCTSNLSECASVNFAATNTVEDGDVSPSHPCSRELMSLLVGFGVLSKPVPYKPRKDRHLCTNEVFCKNLFLKDRRGHFYIVICDEQNDLDLKTLRRKLKAYRNFSFGSQDEMEAIFHVSPGGLTPFALMHGSARDVRVVMTKDLTTDKDVLLNFHPLDANLTLPVRLTHLIKFLDHFRFHLEIVDMSC